MKNLPWLRWVALALAPLLLFGCLEINGQRLTLRYDAALDKLYLLLQYDGIYNSKEHDQADAEGKLMSFIENRDLMLFDWFGHFERTAIRDLATDEYMPAAVRNLGALLAEQVEVVNLGIYRDPAGRLGAAQMVVFHQASRLIAAANAAINAEILAVEGPTDDGDWNRTMERWKAMAESGEEWISIDGHSLQYRFAVDPTEWRRAKLEFLTDLAKDDDPSVVMPNFGHTFLAALPLSFEQASSIVTMRIGEAGAPSTMRCTWRDRYDPNMEDKLRELLPEDFDRRLAAHVLGGSNEGGYIAAIAKWGPAEEKVRAVLGAARSLDAAERGRALQWLASFATEWNAGAAFPEAPKQDGDGDAAYLKSWGDWYRAVSR